jgi:hypothetical protein
MKATRAGLGVMRYFHNGRASWSMSSPRRHKATCLPDGQEANRPQKVENFACYSVLSLTLPYSLI